jgi:hypothetical protein
MGKNPAANTELLPGTLYLLILRTAIRRVTQAAR